MNPTLNPLTPSHPPNSRHSYETFGTHSILHPLGLLRLFFSLPSDNFALCLLAQCCK